MTWLFCNACGQAPSGRTQQVPANDSASLLWTDFRIGERPPVGYYDGLDSMVRQWKLKYRRVDGGCAINDRVRTQQKTFQAASERYFHQLEKIYGQHWKQNFDAEVAWIDSLNALPPKNRPEAGTLPHGIPVTKQAALYMLSEPSITTIPRVINDLYPVIKVLPALTDDSVWIVRRLREQGWEQLDGGSGNWPGGPRFLHVTMRKGSLFCTVDKAYSYYRKDRDGIYSLRVTEQFTISRQP